jgi:lysophospholipase L1-like esterase
MVAPTRLGESQSNRREFIVANAGLTTAAVAALAATDRAWANSTDASDVDREPFLKPGQTILFQGDSITDAGRKKDDPAFNSPAALGKGYAWLAAAQLLVNYSSDNLKIYNRGISGNKVYQLAERWQQDCLDLKPDVLSILIGVNDFWHKQKHGYEGTLETYENDYRKLIQQTKEALPQVRLIICEPFVLPVGAVEASWREQFAGYQAAAKRMAEEAGARFVPFQAMFDIAATVAPAERWVPDGVHPSADGATLMANWWLRALGA